MEKSYWMRNRVARRRFIRGAGVIGTGAIGAALIGCGSDDDSSSSTPAAPAAAPAAAAPAAATAAPAAATQSAVAQGGAAQLQSSTATAIPQPAENVKRGGHLRFEISGDPPNYDMHANSTYRVNVPLSPVHALLVEFDPLSAVEGPDNVQGQLAQSWTVDNNLKVTFDLHGNAKFHNGQAVTSADVKATFERIANKDGSIVSPRMKNYDAVESIETPDDTHVVVNLNRPAPSLFAMMAQGWNTIYSHKDIQNGMDFKLEINGAGPMKLDKYERGNRFEMSANPDYFIEGRPYLGKQTVYVIPDGSTRFASFQGGETDIFLMATQADAESMMDIMKDKAVLDGPMSSNGFGSINFNTSREPWNDNRVRTAVAMAMNRDEAIAVLSKGVGYHGGYFNPNGIWTAGLDAVQKVPGYKPYSDAVVAEARKMLDAAGVPDGFDATILTRQGSTYENFSLYILDNAKAIGLNFTPDVQETASAYDRLNTRNFDLAPWRHGYAVDDPDALFGEFYVTGAARNYSELSSPEVDDLFLKQSTELDVPTRQELAQKMELAALDLYGKIVTDWSAARMVRRDYVKNVVKHPNLYNANRFETAWLDL